MFVYVCVCAHVCARARMCAHIPTPTLVLQSVGRNPLEGGPSEFRFAGATCDSGPSSELLPKRSLFNVTEGGVIVLKAPNESYGI